MRSCRISRAPPEPERPCEWRSRAAGPHRARAEDWRRWRRRSMAPPPTTTINTKRACRYCDLRLEQPFAAGSACRRLARVLARYSCPGRHASSNGSVALRDFRSQRFEARGGLGWRKCRASRPADDSPTSGSELGSSSAVIPRPGMIASAQRGIVASTPTPTSIPRNPG